MNKRGKFMMSVGIMVALSGFGVASAQAVTSQSNFNSVVPRLQQSHYWEYQNKTTSSPSQVNFSSIGASYTMNVKAENAANGVQYSEKKGIGTGSTASIPNSTPSGTGTRLIVTNNTWALVDVSVSGWFKTN